MDLHFSNGQSASLMSVGKFIVYRPSVNQPVPYPPFAAIPSDDLLHLNDGSMWFDVSITSNYPGSFGIVQLVNYFAQNGVTFNTSFGSFWLDGSGYYEGPKDRSVKCTLFDGPGIYLGLVTASYDGHWKDYVCFTPPGGIPVTLGRIEWNWSASALNPDPLIGWIIESDHVDGPTLYPDDSFPFWSNVKPSSE